MFYAILFNVLIILFAIGVRRRLLPATFLTNLITGLHYTIGITAPTPDQVRHAAVVWIVSMLVIIDVLLALLRWVL